jgi:hypothetical protein
VTLASAVVEIGADAAVAVAITPMIGAARGPVVVVAMDVVIAAPRRAGPTGPPPRRTGAVAIASAPVVAVAVLDRRAIGARVAVAAELAVSVALAVGLAIALAVPAIPVALAIPAVRLAVGRRRVPAIVGLSIGLGGGHARKRDGGEDDQGETTHGTLRLSEKVNTRTA